MTTEEKNKFDRMESHIKEIQKDIANILSALVGNVANGNNGLIHEMQELKQKQSSLELAMTKYKEDSIRKDGVINILKWILAVVTSISVPVISYFLINKT